MGDAEQAGEGQVVGHLTSATVLESGGEWRGDAVDRHVDLELAVVIDGGYAAALELVDLARGGGDADEIVATNVFHCAVAVGPMQESLAGGAEARLLVNGRVAGTGAVPDVRDRVRAAGETLTAVGERLSPGDVVITGSIVQVPVLRGDRLVGELDGLGRVALWIG